MKRIERLILKLKKKMDQIEYKEYLTSLLEQCELGEDAKLYRECVIFDGHANMSRAGGGGGKIYQDWPENTYKGRIVDTWSWRRNCHR